VAISVLNRYMSRELAKILLVSLAGLAVIYLVIDFIDRIDNFLRARAAFPLVLEYFLLKIPLIVEQGIPMSVLMGTLVTLGVLARTNELTALRAAGMSPFRYCTPFLLVACLWSFGDFALAEYVVPLTSTQANRIWNVHVNRRPGEGGFSQERIWYRGDQLLYNIRVLHPRRRMAEGVIIYFFDETFHLVKRLEARKGLWDGTAWTFTDGFILGPATDSDYTVEPFQELRLALPQRPGDFQHLAKAPEEMTWGELNEYVAKIRGEGYDATRYLVDLYTKVAFPCTSLVMALLGIGVALYQGKRGGIATGVAVSVALAFVYAMVFHFLLSLGYAGKLPPLLAAWIPNAFFALTGLFLIALARH
jgi:lipopolysaccharide export system permease protein